MNSSSSCVSPSLASGEKRTVRSLPPPPLPSSNLGEESSLPLALAACHSCAAWPRREGVTGGLRGQRGLRNNLSQTPPSAASPWVSVGLQQKGNTEPSQAVGVPRSRGV